MVADHMFLDFVCFHLSSILLYFCYFLAGPYPLCWLLCVRCVSFLSDSYLFSIRHLSLFPLFIACHKHQTKPLPIAVCLVEVFWQTIPLYL